MASTSTSPAPAMVPPPVETTAAVPRPRLAGLRSFGQAVVATWSSRIGLLLIVVYLAVVVVGLFVGGDPLAQGDDILAPPGAEHLFGTDQLGRDIFARTAAGARLSLAVALASVVLGLAVAMPLGMVAGYFARTWIDELIMRCLDVIMALPLFILGVVFLGLSRGSGGTILGVPTPVEVQVVIVIAITTLPKFARVARAATMVEREEDYADSLRVIGVSRFRIIFGEISINVLPPVLVQAFLWMAVAIFAEAALSFLGLGVQAPDPTLGNLLHDARNYVLHGAWWYSVLPGAVLMIVIVGLNLVGDALTDRLSPQLRD
ncbi:ABC transporter permease [Phytohabitans sp. ZYX-F-186]|uniref:ABC transporter permease n=1 Tax=Phytohabitans maris TaxID=3071409 RepID=A0ABU0ZSV8_9ACTN|nr:ABC transporter permease [Phytohabitans sp. ZYX-F-186]MDQ7910121.1 ABC transporter permease [Phytohabitans sp. ZYX-F-186]